MPLCPECDATVGADENFCQECGANLMDGSPATGRESDGESSDRDEGISTGTGTDDGWRDEYSTVVWAAAVIVGLLTFPLGLIVPVYFYVKASGADSSTSPRSKSGR